MQIDLKNSIEITLGIAAIVAIIYKVNKTEFNIKQEIAKANARLDIISKEYSLRKEMVDYLIHRLDEKIDHKFNQLQSSQREIQNFLSKNHNFIIRNND